MASLTACRSPAFAGKAVQAPRAAARRASFKRSAPVYAKYGDESVYFDLNDLENTIGSWDMYGQDDNKRYNGLQSEFFERAASGLTRREYLLALVALGGGGGILAWGGKGAKLTNLPITVGPQKAPEIGPRGRA